MSLKLLQSTFVVGSMTLLSRITGLVRDMVFAQVMGTAAAADAFFVAFRIPNFLRRIFGEGALSAAFVPVFTEYREQRRPGEARALVDLVTGRLGAVLVVLCAAGVLAAPFLVWGLAPGFTGHPEKYAMTVDALRLTFPYLLFISLVALSAGMLNTLGRFAAPAVTPVLLNLALIGAAVTLVPVMPNVALALAAGVLIAGALQLAFQVPFLAAEGWLPRPRLRAVTREERAGAEGARQVGRLMLPALFGTSVAQINLVVNTILASFLVTGSVSWLYYADRLMEFPLGVFGIALGTVLLPSLARAHERGEPELFSETIDWSLRWSALVSIPAAVGLVVLAGPIVTTIFQHGAFSPSDVERTAAALVAFSVGLPALVAVRVLAPGFFARQNTATPVRVAAIAVGINILASVALVVPLRHVGLAAATSIAAVANAGLLYRLLRRDDLYRPGGGWGGLAAKVGLATAAMGVLLSWGAGPLEGWVEAGVPSRIGRLAGWIVAGVVLYCTVLALLGVRLRQLMLRRLDTAP